MNNNIIIAITLQIFFAIYFTVSWIVNLIQFIGCDFAEPYKDEVIYGIGVFIPPAAMVTVWF